MPRPFATRISSHSIRRLRGTWWKYLAPTPPRESSGPTAIAQASPPTSVKSLFVTCFPKSGSTYLTRLLAMLTGSPVTSMSNLGGQNEQDLYEPAIEAALEKTSVSHQHAKGTNNNVALMVRYGIRPVILVRDIFDVVISLYDHIEKESPLTPTGYIPEAYHSMTRDERLRFLVHFHVPWYFNFYGSWLEHAAEVGAMWMTYEQFFRDRLGGARRLCDFYELDVSDRQLGDAIAAMADTFTRYNVGVSGRGASIPDASREQILRMARSTGIAARDLERLGIRSTARSSPCL